MLLLLLHQKELGNRSNGDLFRHEIIHFVLFSKKPSGIVSE